MIQTMKINGVNVVYAIATLGVDEAFVSFKLGATVKDIGQVAGADAAIDFNSAGTDNDIPIGRVIADGKTVISDSPRPKPATSSLCCLMDHGISARHQLTRFMLYKVLRAFLRMARVLPLKALSGTNSPTASGKGRTTGSQAA
ncbi:hypothetical protein H7F31_00700 [Paenibacillus sp. PAMC21692]|nr:hypothetical protein [Paenibacillus sp. PAMC21692]QNK57536.1 hypothetical protein H7F31_00700 [Paenibacillus sp. PAMC21692]